MPNSGFIAVAAGERHSLGLKPDGSIIAWGDNSSGQCNAPSPNSGFAAIAGGDGHSLGLKSDGSIVAWGYNGLGQCNVPSPNSGFVAITAGHYHSLGLKSDGSMAAWGWAGFYGQCNVPTPNTGFVAIAAGGYRSLAIRSSSTSSNAVKLAPLGQTAFLDSVVVTATAAQTGGFLYIEDENRISGIRVSASEQRLLGDLVSVGGTLSKAANGELELAGATTGLLSSGDPLNPLALSNAALGGGPFGLQEGILGASGLNNIGILVTTFGSFEKTSDTTFTLDDGSGVMVKCVVPAGVTLNPLWNYAVVTGISSCEKVGADLHRLLRVRTQSDITPL